jgi:hypothetical protein
VCTELGPRYYWTQVNHQKYYILLIDRRVQKHITKTLRERHEQKDTNRKTRKERHEKKDTKRKARKERHEKKVRKRRRGNKERMSSTDKA